MNQRLTRIKAAYPPTGYFVGMVTTFIYRCPMTGGEVEGHEVEDARPAPRPLRIYVAERCPACTGLHIVNPRTGALLSQEAPAFTRLRATEPRASLQMAH